MEARGGRDGEAPDGAVCGGREVAEGGSPRDAKDGVRDAAQGEDPSGVRATTGAADEDGGGVGALVLRDSGNRWGAEVRAGAGSSSGRRRRRGDGAARPQRLSDRMRAPGRAARFAGSELRCDGERASGRLARRGTGSGTPTAAVLRRSETIAKRDAAARRRGPHGAIN